MKRDLRFEVDEFASSGMVEFCRLVRFDPEGEESMLLAVDVGVEVPEARHSNSCPVLGFFTSTLFMASLKSDDFIFTFLILDF